MEKLTKIYDFIKKLSHTADNNNKIQAEKNLTELYFEIHNDPTIPFKEKKVKCELVAEQLLYLLKVKNLP